MKNEIKTALTKLASQIDATDKIYLDSFKAKLAKACMDNPSDKTMGAMLRVLDSNKSLLVSKASLVDLYNKMYHSGTVFAEFFGEELGIKKLASTVKYAEKFVSDEEESPVDKKLVNTLHSIMGNNIRVNEYSKKSEASSIEAVQTTLSLHNIKSSKITVEAGDDTCLIVKAEFETPKGLTRLYVPVNIVNKVASTPKSFITDTGVFDISKSNVENAIISQAGVASKLDGKSLFTVVKNASAEKVSDTELALAKFKLKQSEKQAFASQNIFDRTEKKEEIKPLGKLASLDSLENKFAGRLGQAEFKFGEKIVTNARDLVQSQLKQFGFNNAQVAIKNSDQEKIFCAVNLGKVAFTVPVRVDNNKVQQPSYLLCNGQVNSFTKTSIATLFANNEFDYKTAAAASPLFSFADDDLLNTVRTAVEAGDKEKAEDALNVLAARDNKVLYLRAFDIYKNNLMKKEAAPKASCNFVIKTASTSYPVCGHTGLPLHKVYQDKHGNCRPLYRRGQEDAGIDSVLTTNQKLFG